jgi:hypothetical protein
MLNATITDVLPGHVTPTGVLTWTPPAIAPDGVWTEQVTVAVTLDICGSLTNTLQVATEEGVVATVVDVVDTCPRFHLPLLLRQAQ